MRTKIELIEKLRSEIEALPSGARRECLRREYHRQIETPEARRLPIERRLDTSDQYSQLPARQRPR